MSPPPDLRVAAPMPFPVQADTALPQDLPPLPPEGQGRPLVLVSWNGREAPLARILADTTPQFELLVFDYSGAAGPSGGPVPGLADGPDARLLSARTECKGDIYNALAGHLRQRLDGGGALPRFVALVDDDVLTSVHDLNRLLHIGACHGLHVFSAALSHDSEYTHRWTLRQPSRMLREALWVEVMMPVYDGALFMAAAPHFAGNVSSWGLDQYLLPTLQQLLDRPRCAIVDAVMASHVRPITSGDGSFRHGLTARQEVERMKAHCLALVDRHRPALRGTPWFRRVFRQRHYRSRWQQLVYGLGRPLRRWLDAST